MISSTFKPNVTFFADPRINCKCVNRDIRSSLASRLRASASDFYQIRVDVLFTTLRPVSWS